jgi:hypothetical protein
MKTWSKSTRLIGAMISLGVIIAICTIVAIRRAGAVIGVIRPAVIFTVNPGQTARINVIGPTQNNWNNGAARRIMLGFDVYKANETSPRTGSEAACVKYHMIERQACEAVLTPGEAASFDFAVPVDGVATQISPVFSVEGNDAIGALTSSALVPTIEMREGGRTTGFLVLPAVQRVDESNDRR